MCRHLAGMLCSCAVALIFTLSGPTAAAETPVVASYSVSVPADLSSARISACFADGLPTSLRSRVTGDRHLSGLRSNGQGRVRVVAGGARMDLSAVADGSCVDYQVDLRAAVAESNRAGMVDISGDAILVDPNLLIWWPKTVTGSRLQARFQLPAGMGVSAP